MPTAIANPPRPAARPARLGRRLLGSALVDSLVGPHGIDRYLELVRPSWTIRDARARVVRIERQTADSVTLHLKPNGAFAGYAPGQFVQLTVEIDGVRRSRCYSPAGSARADGALELTVKTHPEGLVSRFLVARAHVGMVVGLSPADGDFFLPAERPERLLLISGGSGITPVLSMLRTLCDEGHTGHIDFVHYAPTPGHALYRAELEALAARHPNLRLLRSYTRAPGAGELDGHFSTAHLAAIGRHADAETFVCGPPALIDGVRSAWTERGLERRLHVESFVPPSLAIRSDEADGTVSFARSGAGAANDGRTLLEQAEAAGLSPEFGCRMGICASCTCRKTAGVVRNAISGEVSSAEEEDIRLCVSVPVGDVQLEL
jgi:stearoyl-CoA 9-desaturase NADPH oxidoreductase